MSNLELGSCLMLKYDKDVYVVSNYRVDDKDKYRVNTKSEFIISDNEDTGKYLKKKYKNNNDIVDMTDIINKLINGV